MQLCQKPEIFQNLENKIIVKQMSYQGLSSLVGFTLGSELRCTAFYSILFFYIPIYLSACLFHLVIALPSSLYLYTYSCNILFTDLSTVSIFVFQSPIRFQSLVRISVFFLFYVKYEGRKRHILFHVRIKGGKFSSFQKSSDAGGDFISENDLETV